MAYKFTNYEVEFIVQDWHAKWRELVCAEEISTGPPVDALVEPI